MFLSGMVGTASQKKYKISLASSAIVDSKVPDAAYPGEYVFIEALSAEAKIIGNTTGNKIAISAGTPSVARAPVAPSYFVMPAEDVTIS